MFLGAGLECCSLKDLTEVKSAPPVVLFAYARPELFAATLADLQENRVPRLYIFCDGAKGSGDLGAVREVRRIARSVRWCDVVVRERATNAGLGRAILNGVAEVFAREESAIVFEDDLQCSPGTYRFLSAALDHYAEDSRVMSVTGWTHPAITPSDVGNEPYFDGKAECWSWGAWKRSWVGMERTALYHLKAFTAGGGDPLRYGPDMPLMAQESEQKNLWAVRWWYHHLASGGLCLRPPKNLVAHLGWDSRATTCKPSMRFWSNGLSNDVLEAPRNWPTPIEHPDCPRLWDAAIRVSSPAAFPN